MTGDDGQNGGAMESAAPIRPLAYRKTAIASIVLGVAAPAFIWMGLPGPFAMLFACFAWPCGAFMAGLALCFGDPRTKAMALASLALNVLPVPLMLLAMAAAVSH